MTLRRIVLVTKADGYGNRVQLFQDALQQGLESVLAVAAGHARLRRDTWSLQDTSDGEVAVLPGDEPEDVVVGRFVQELNSALDQHNRLAAESARLRLRLAVHFGPATPSAKGFSGDGQVLAALLCGSRPLRSALEQTDCALAVMLSEEVYMGTVHALRVPLVDPDRMRRVRIHEREDDVDVHAWLWLPGRDAAALHLDPPDPHEPPDPRDPHDPRDEPERPRPERPRPGRQTDRKDVRIKSVRIKDSTITTNGSLIFGDQFNTYHGRDRER